MERALRGAGFTERTFDTGEVKLNYAEGPASGPPLLLIPGQSMPRIGRMGALLRAGGWSREAGEGG